MRRRLPAAPTLAGCTLAVALLHGCGDDGGGSDDPVTGQIGEAGGVVRGPGGFAVSAPAGVVDAPLALTLSEVARPLDLPEGWVPLGPTFAVVANREVSSDGDVTGFVIGLPVPAGADTARLGAAVFVPESDTLDAPMAHWRVLRGQYAAAENKLLVRTPSVGTAPHTLRLVTADWLSSPTAPQPDPDGIGSLRQRLVSDIDWAGGFEVETSGLPRPSPEWVAFYESTLEEAYEKYRDAEFVPFALQYAGLDLWLDPPSILFGDPPRFLVEVRTFRRSARLDAPCEENDEAELQGTYHAGTETLTVCAREVPPGANAAWDTAARDTVYHELFHAQQKRFLSRRMTLDHAWFAEGTATLAESLQDSPIPARRPRDRRPVTVSLLADGRANTYATQDFWAFAAASDGLTLEDLVEPFFLRGAIAPDDIHAAFADGPFSSGFDGTFARWVEDQVLDATDCTVDEALIGEVTDLGSVVFTTDEEPDYPDATAVALGRLTAGAYALDVANTRADTARLEIALTGDLASPARSLVVVRGDVGGACTTRPGEGNAAARRAVVELASGDQAGLTILVSNGDHGADRDGTLTVGAPVVPRVERLSLGIRADADTDEGSRDRVQATNEPTGNATLESTGIWESAGVTEQSDCTFVWNQTFTDDTGSVADLYVRLDGMASVITVPVADPADGRAACLARVDLTVQVHEPVTVTISGSSSGTGVFTNLGFFDEVAATDLYLVGERLPVVPLDFTTTLSPGRYYFRAEPEIVAETELPDETSANADGTFEVTLSFE